MAAAFSIDEISEDLNETFTTGKLNKSSMLLIGAVGVAAVVFISKRTPTPAAIEPETIPDVELQGYPQMNPADLDQEFAEYSSVIFGQVQSNLEGFYNDLMETQTDLYEENKKYIEEVKAGLEKQLGTDPDTVEKHNSAAWTVGYGLSGTNPNANVNFAENRDKLKEEIERTQSVIAYRNAQGLDTKNQTAHLNNLRKL